MMVVAPAALAKTRAVRETPPVPAESHVRIFSFPLSLPFARRLGLEESVTSRYRRTLKQHALARLQRPVAVERVPHRRPGPYQRRPLDETVGRLGQLDGEVRGHAHVLAQGAVDGPAEGVEAVLDGAVQGRGARGEQDGVADGEALNAGTHLDDLAGGVRARDDVVLDGERVREVGDGDVPVVQGDPANPDEHLVGAGAGDRLLELLEPVVAASRGPAEYGLGRHSVRW